MESGASPAAFDWVDSSVISEIDATFSATFSSQQNSSLQIKRLRSPTERDGDLGVKPHLWTRDVFNEVDIEEYARCCEPCQIYCIRQKHSYARLYITRDLFDGLLKAYSVFDRIWDFVLPFSFKTKESDIGHAPFRFRQHESTILSGARLGSFECAYGFRYVELNHRLLGRRENPDYDPWSVRQSAIYQQYDSKYGRIMFLLISPSENARKHLEETVIKAGSRQRRLNAFDLHRIVISTLHENWRLYIRSLEALMTQQSERVTLAQVQSETAKLSPLTDFAVNFVDRQRLKMIEDKVLDLVIIFESLYNTLSQLQRQCRLHCLGFECKDCSCLITIEELEEQMHEAQVNLTKANILHKRAQGTSQLLSDLLDYENAQIAHLNERALNGLVAETKEENSKMRVLSEKSTADAAAVKILTVITLIYLPMTVVANFFSSQLIKVDESGQISVVSGSWWFAVISVPLTVLTFLAWKLWLDHATRVEERKHLALDEKELSSRTQSWASSFGLGWTSRWEKLPVLRNRQTPHQLASSRHQSFGEAVCKPPFWYHNHGLKCDQSLARMCVTVESNPFQQGMRRRFRTGLHLMDSPFEQLILTLCKPEIWGLLSLVINFLLSFPILLAALLHVVYQRCEKARNKRDIERTEATEISSTRPSNLPRITVNLELASQEQGDNSAEVGAPALANDSPLERLSITGRSRASSTASSHRRLSGSQGQSRPDASPLWNALSRNDRPPEIMSSTLAGKLRASSIEWPLEGNHYFLPINILEELVTNKKVKDELLWLQIPIEEVKLDSYVNSICSKAKKLFTILLLRQQVRAIFEFLDEGITDEDLPFTRCYLQPPGTLHSSGAASFTLCTKSHSAKLLDHSKCGIKAISSWNPTIIRDICAHQWEVQAPVFEKGSVRGEIPHFDLDDNTVLPFIEDHEGKVTQTMAGGYSHVWGVRIHPAHQNVYQSKDPRVPFPLLAIKRPYSIDHKDFKRERDMLSALQVREHKHLVKLLATYKYKSHYHLIFPYANTNLRGYWHDTGLPHWNRETYLWFLQQVNGIASGINAIHNFESQVPMQSDNMNSKLTLPGQTVRLTVSKAEERFGRHGDIKPENILWSNELQGTPKEGVLTICDLGLGRFHRLESRSHVDPRHLSGSPTYAPPEVKLGELVSRAYDIWSLGCLYLEFISWLLEGGSSIESFATLRKSTALDKVEDDTFYSIKKNENGKEKGFIRQGVKDWIERLKRHPRCSFMVNALLMLVQSHLLIIAPKSRISAQSLDTELKKILERAKVDRTYLLGKDVPVLDPDAGIKVPKGQYTQYGGSPFEASNTDSQARDVNMSDANITQEIPDIEISEAATSSQTDVTSHRSATWPPNRSHSDSLKGDSSYDNNSFEIIVRRTNGSNCYTNN